MVDNEPSGADIDQYDEEMKEQFACEELSETSLAEQIENEPDKLDDIIYDRSKIEMIAQCPHQSNLEDEHP
ncbi:unnamed protein product, partial [marine sediment metagenome]